MLQSTHDRAVELHNLAAHAHAAAATAHDKGDHLTAHELTKQAHEHSVNALTFLAIQRRHMKQSKKKKILLIDLADPRCATRVRMLIDSGYEVEVRADHEVAELADHEANFDLVLLSLHWKKLKEASAYSERLRKSNPALPILLLTDVGVFVPRGTLSNSIETGHPEELMVEIAQMLVGHKHIRELNDAFLADG